MDRKCRSGVCFAILFLVGALGLFISLRDKYSKTKETYLQYTQDNPITTETKLTLQLKRAQQLALQEAAYKHIEQAANIGRQPSLLNTKREQCIVGANEGDTCVGMVFGYGIYNVSRLILMNKGLKCDPPGILPTGATIIIRNDQDCGTNCTPTLC
ncbi:hypothetical protein BV898_18386 [Hypsibius exemplaris]|uniref:LysM domain-containing protein n=1 Tax=Hypsibius exemplaris TaxID=2072580 RepID=A0A9X6NJW9_HYPEX|nr:hypothetical protein BV898_18386 [Hypsibius exemplaris]